jgi:hypothetical protein
MRHQGKVSPLPILSGFAGTLVDTEGRRSKLDVFEQYVLPALIGLALLLWGPKIPPFLGGALLTLAGLFAAFLFSLTIQLLERASAWSESQPSPGPATSTYAILLGELSANAAYAALVSAAAAVAALAAAITTNGAGERITVALTAGLFAHLGTTMLLVLRRVFLLTRQRLTEARTGGPSARRSA